MWLRPSAAVVGVTTGAAIVYDEITARTCVEYFTRGHSPVFGTDDPTLLASRPKPAWSAASRHRAYPVGRIVDVLPPGRYVGSLTDLWTHLASYLDRGVGGPVLCTWPFVRRRRLAATSAS